MTNIPSLKEAYKLRKLEEGDKALHEARELLESYCLIVEKLDTGSISRIVDAMNGVEQALASVLDKLPSLKAGLDAAEAELTQLVSGAAGNNPAKTGKMLGKALAFYQHLSSFLRQDLAVLLRSRILAPAKADPESPVGAKIVPAFQQALALEKTGNFIQRFFSSTNIPYIDNAKFAQELSGLSFNELEGLTQVGRMPAIMTTRQIDQVAQAAIAVQPAQPTYRPATRPAIGSRHRDRQALSQEELRRVLSHFIPQAQMDVAIAQLLKAIPR